MKLCRSRLHAVKAMVVLLAVILSGATPSGRSPAAGKAPTDSLQAQLDAAREAYRLAQVYYRDGRGDVETVYRWSRRWLEAEQAGGGGKDQNLAALKGHLERMKELQKQAEARWRTGLVTSLDTTATKFYLAEAEDWLAQAKEK
jgi:outer membrane protein TolC